MVARAVGRCFAAAAVVLAVVPGPALAANAVELQVTPGTVGVGAFFRGAEITLKGRAPAGSEVFAELESGDRPVTLTEKVKEGVFWLNKDEVLVTGLPSFFMAVSPVNAAGLPAGLRRKLGLSSGFAGLAGRAVVTADGPLGATRTAPYVQAMLAIDEQKGLYQQRQVTGDRIAAGSFAYRLRLPQDMPAGPVQVTAWAVEDGRVVATGHSLILVRTVGMLASLGYLAQHRGTVYGGMAALVAAVVGLAVNTLFSGLEGLLRRRGVWVPKEDRSRVEA